MGIETAIGTLLLGIVLVTAALRLFAAPLRLALKVAINAVLGLAALAAVDLAGGITGIHLGLNAVNALVVGVLGLPGLGLLVLLEWVFV